MRTLIIYISFHHGNTEKVARKMAEVLGADLLKTNEVSDVSILKEYDLVGFGSGIYVGRHHGSLLNLADKLPNLKNKRTFVFSTSGFGECLINRFNQPLCRKLTDKGFNVIGKFSCRGFDTVGPLKLIGGMHKGRPNEEDLKNAENFARSLKEKIK